MSSALVNRRPHTRIGIRARNRPRVQVRVPRFRFSHFPITSERAAPRLQLKSSIRSKIGDRSKSKHQAANKGVGGTWSKFTLYNPPKFFMRKVLKNVKEQVFHYDETDQVLNATAGIQLQSLDASHSLYGQVDLDNIRIQAVKLVTNNVVPANEGTQSTDVWHLGATNKMMMTNNATALAVIAIYDIITKRDAYSTNGPVNTWADGLLKANGGVGNNHHQVGSMPQHSNEFNTLFKVLKVTHVELPSGSTHIHRVSFSPNRKFPGFYSYLDGQLANGISFFKGWTLHTMVVVHGAPCDSTANPTTVSTGGFKLNIVSTKTYRYKVLQSQQGYNSYTTNLGTFADEKDMLEEQNIAAAYGTA